MVDAGRIAILGGSGFVGSALVRRLAGRPVALRLISRDPSPVPGRADIEIWPADLAEPGLLAQAVDDVTTIVHLVAHTDAGWRVADDERARQVNVGLTADLVDVLAARRVRSPPVVLFAGATSQVGPVGPRPLDGSEPDRPDSPYARQKQESQRLLEAADAAGVLRAVTLRLPTVYGYPRDTPRVPRGIVTAMVIRAMRGLPLPLWNDGSVLRDLVHVDDVADAFAHALDHVDDLAGRHWVVGSGRSRRLDNVFSRIADVVAEWSGLPPVPALPVAPPPGTVDAADGRHVRTDPGPFRARTGWTCRTSLSTGIRETVTSLSSSIQVPLQNENA